MWRLLIVSVLFAAASAPAFAQDKKEEKKQDKKPVKAEETWSGRFAGEDKEALKKLAPPNNVITDQKTFEKLWKAWRTEVKVPQIDFAKKFVVVATTGGPNMLNAKFTLDDNGNLGVQAETTLVEGPGFGYVLSLLDRDGVKAVQGKKFDKGE